MRNVLVAVLVVLLLGSTAYGGWYVGPRAVYAYYPPVGPVYAYPAPVVAPPYVTYSPVVPAPWSLRRPSGLAHPPWWSDPKVYIIGSRCGT